MYPEKLAKNSHEYHSASYQPVAGSISRRDGVGVPEQAEFLIVGDSGQMFRIRYVYFWKVNCG
jgi:hypothetical protein